MPTYINISKVPGCPSFKKPMGDILAEVMPGGCIKILSPLETHTDRQRRWIKGVCLKGLSGWNGDTIDEWDMRLKALCGGDLLKEETIYLGPGTTCIRKTIKGVGKRSLTAYIENILSAAITHSWPVTPPDADLRK